MRARMTITQFENNLEGLQGGILLFAMDDELNLLFDFAYPDLIGQADALKPKLEKLSMYENVKDALAQSETLARKEKYDEAADVILEINRALMKASGTWDKLIKRFPQKANSISGMASRTGFIIRS